MPPDIIAGRYRVEREVGRGGMGSVWLCQDEKLGREVAVKQVGGLPGESSMHLARALREARHSAALNHPNVVAIFDALEEGDHVWLVMEYVPSRTLDEIIRAEGALPPVRAARIVAQVADGLAAAHALGTVHRDVKPSNILVRDDDRALIADFGIARTVGQEQLTRSGMVTGTPVYFAPELARGREPSPASDVWALGVSLYAAVEGGPPYPDEANAIALLNTIASQPPPRPVHAGPLTEPIIEMLDPDPATRWSMAEVAQRLHQVATEEPAPADAATALLPAVRETEPAPPPDTVPRAARVVPLEPDRRRRAPLLLAALVVLALVAAGGWWLTRPDDDPTATPSEDSPSRTSAPKSDRSPTPSDGATTGDSAGDDTDEDPSPQESSTADEPSQDETPAAAPVGSGAELVEDYYSLLPDDTDGAWALLTSAAQDRIGRDSFDGFWATVDDVRVEGTEPVSDDVIEVSLVYTTDGQSDPETRRLQVEQTDGGYLISADLGRV